MKKKYLIHVLFLCWMAVLLRITVFRGDFGEYGFCTNGRINMRLFQEYVPLIRANDWDRIIYLFVGNIIWFVPLGMYAQWRHPGGGLLRPAAWGLLLSVCIETMQYFFGTGISEADDLILNTAGALMGAALLNEIRRCPFIVRAGRTKGNRRKEK